MSVVGPVFVEGPAGPPATEATESTDAAVRRLCRQMREVCASAVDPLEIAAALEAEAGLTGPILRARYGCPDVFTLADEMYRLTARWPAEPPSHELWAADPRTHVGHAVLYGLPAASYAVATPLLSGGGALTVVLVSMVTSWTLSQALAYLGYARLSGLDRGGAAQVLRAGLPAGAAALGIALAVAAAFRAPVGFAVLAFAAAQGVYLLAATVLLVLKAERWVFVALAPGALASTAYLVAGRPSSVDGVLWLPLVVSALLACAAAVVLTRTSGPRARLTPSRTELRGALAQAQFGLAAAGLLAFPVAVVGFGAGSAVSAVAVLTLPLSLSMGAAEWSLYRYRRDVHALLQRCRTVGEFGPGARAVLLGAVLRYLGAAAVLIAATVVVLHGSLADPWSAVRLCLSYLALGGALFVALLLQALGGGAWTGLACGAALVLEGALVLGGAVDVMTAQLVASALLFTGLVLVAGAVLSRVESHI